ncbi:YibE/F family protein [Patescibacteria group bacterium]|nr:YibE/F family protein [Patescibacteria group bacterium]MBU1922165.1 YibE/F family protein [Patescibacteria group bacterium]
MKKIAILFIIFALSGILTGSVFAQEEAFEDTSVEESAVVDDLIASVEQPTWTGFEKARVIGLETKSQAVEFEGGERVETYREIKLEVLSGGHKGEQFAFADSPETNPLKKDVRVGQKLLVYVEDFEDGAARVSIDSFYRVPELLLLVLVFLLLLLVLGGWRKGLKTILSLMLALILIFKVLVPAILAGWSAINITMIIAALVTFITLALIGGMNKKSYAAMLGTIAGVLVAFLFSYIFTELANLVGLSTEENRLLAGQNPDLNAKYIFLSAILIGALGAAMDVAISIASSISEVKSANQLAGFKKLFKSGINVGRDIIGTMSNTLIFAYVGAALPTVLLFHQLGQSYFKFLNFDFIADEVVRSIGGSIGLVAVIPITAFIASYFFSLESGKKQGR